MNCEKFEEVVTELARDRKLAPIGSALPEDAVAHLANCADCLQRFQDQGALSRQLLELSAQMKLLTAPAHLEAQLVKTYRESLGMKQVTRRQVVPVSSWQRAALAAAAILIAAIAGLSWYATRQSQPGEHKPEQVAKNTPGDPEDFVGRLRAQRDEIARPTVKRVKTISRKRVQNKTKQEPLNPPAANDIEREVATHFMPIGFAGPINPQDGGELVRVELSRSAMLSLGLPVNMDRFGQSVKADVLLGSDGLARAIRFVQ